MEERSSWLDRIFTSERVSVEVVCADRVINPFSTIDFYFYADGELIKQFQTIFKCDTLENCGLCFTHDFSSVVLTRGREKKTIPTTYRGVLLWGGVPVFEEQYLDEIKLYPSFFTGKRGSVILVKNFREILVEGRDGLYRIVPDNNPVGSVFTERLTLSHEFFL